MKKHSLWTHKGLRLHYIKSQEGRPWNWLFLPGGPGLGSESLSELSTLLTLPGTLWHVDLPGDGSNKGSFKDWALALEEGIEALDHVILVAHSTGGMYALSLPILEKKLSGLVLMDSAPDASWQQQVAPSPELRRLDALYRANPSHENLKALTLAAAPLCFTEKGLRQGKALLEALPYNPEAHLFSEQHFDATYQAKWVPQHIPTLILAGAEDHLTQLHLFRAKEEFRRDNIILREIPHAGHYPWIENPLEVAAAFDAFTHLLL